MNEHLTIVQNSETFSGLFPSSCIPKNTTFRKLDLFLSSGEGGGEDTYSVKCVTYSAWT
jgi:hypothetical protein